MQKRKFETPTEQFFLVRYQSLVSFRNTANRNGLLELDLFLPSNSEIEVEEKGNADYVF